MVGSLDVSSRHLSHDRKPHQSPVERRIDEPDDAHEGNGLFASDD